MVISLDSTYLNGVWSSTGDFYTGGSHHVGGELYVVSSGFAGGIF